jgi:hypothetical protein
MLRDVRRARFHELRKAKIGDLRQPGLRNQDVLRLQTAVNDPLLVRRRKPDHIVGAQPGHMPVMTGLVLRGLGDAHAPGL